MACAGKTGPRGAPGVGAARARAAARDMTCVPARSKARRDRHRRSARKHNRIGRRIQPRINIAIQGRGALYKQRLAESRTTTLATLVLDGHSAAGPSSSNVRKDGVHDLREDDHADQRRRVHVLRTVKAGVWDQLCCCVGGSGLDHWRIGSISADNFNLFTSLRSILRPLHPSGTKMHRCLQISEVVARILSCDSVSKGELSRLATVCRAVSEPALDILWGTHWIDIKDLLDLIPAGLISLDSSNKMVHLRQLVLPH